MNTQFPEEPKMTNKLKKGNYVISNQGTRKL